MQLNRPTTTTTTDLVRAKLRLDLRRAPPCKSPPGQFAAANHQPVYYCLLSNNENSNQTCSCSENRFNALTSLLLRRSPASRAISKCKSPIKGAGFISTLRSAGPKSSLSSTMAGATGLAVGSLSAGLHSHSATMSAPDGHAKLPAYFYKTNNATHSHHNHSHHHHLSSSLANEHCSTPGYYTSASHHSNNYGQHHHYQQPPTADLLGTGYQCQQQQQQHPILHIAAGNNPSQTTRLVWNTGNDGFTIEGGSYLPLSNAPRSDSGSVYQTIY